MSKLPEQTEQATDKIASAWEESMKSVLEARMVDRVTKAWADVPNATDWVEDLRGGEVAAQKEPEALEVKRAD